METIINDVRSTYDQIGLYFSSTRKNIWPEVKPYVNKLKKGNKVLDIGCGNGRLLTGISKEVNYYGIDFSQTLLDEARKKFPDRQFVLGNLLEEKTWESLGEFDAIFCIAVLHHIPDKEGQMFILNQIKSHLNKGGFAFITTWNLWQFKYLKYHFLSFREKLTNWRWVKIPFQKEAKRFCFAMNGRYLFNLLNQTGVEVVDIYYSDKNGEKIGIRSGQNLCGFFKNY